MTEHDYVIDQDTGGIIITEGEHAIATCMDSEIAKRIVAALDDAESADTGPGVDSWPTAPLMAWRKRLWAPLNGTGDEPGLRRYYAISDGDEAFEGGGSRFAAEAVPVTPVPIAELDTLTREWAAVTPLLCREPTPAEYAFVGLLIATDEMGLD